MVVVARMASMTTALAPERFRAARAAGSKKTEMVGGGVTRG
jgi:hypothetical protein